METGAIIIEESGDLIDPMEVDSQGNMIYCEVEKEIDFLLGEENNRKKGQTGSASPPPLLAARLFARPATVTATVAVTVAAAVAVDHQGRRETQHRAEGHPQV